jgi:hypothetical protein
MARLPAGLVDSRLVGRASAVSRASLLRGATSALSDVIGARLVNRRRCREVGQVTGATRSLRSTDGGAHATYGRPCCAAHQSLPLPPNHNPIQSELAPQAPGAPLTATQPRVEQNSTLVLSTAGSHSCAPWLVNRREEHTKQRATPCRSSPPTLRRHQAAQAAEALVAGPA